MTPNELYVQAKESFILTNELEQTLMEVLEYSSISFLNQAVEILRIFKARIDRGDKIENEASGKIFTEKTFRKYVKETYSEYIYQHVYLQNAEMEKSYFYLDPCEGGYSLVLAKDGKQKTYEWISCLSQRFSLVFMIATGIVYIKDMKTNTYAPFISENGKYCRYDKEKGLLAEV